MPEVPVSVWEQIPVVIVFAFLLAGLGWLLVKVFSKAVAEINAHYAEIVRQNNEQWQKYFDAKDESNRIVNEQVVEKLEELTNVISKLVDDFRDHDRRMGEKIHELPHLQLSPSAARTRRNRR
jgi:predicted PurR-regulated permease PerM